MGREFEVRVDHRAFFLHPEIPPEGQVRRSRPFEPAGEKPRWQAMADEEGLTMRRAELTPYTRFAQAATEYAKQHDRADAFHHAAYRALWEDGANLGDFAVLEKLATSVGLDWADLGPRLTAREFDPVLEEQHDEAIQVGVQGVPAFVVDSHFWFSGAQPYQLFRLAARKAIEARQSEDASA
ncbi:MAG: DsbA family protein [Chloroflexi bacterium]|nr:DsbA family protein [Chloroflexota bacterium]